MQKKGPYIFFRKKNRFWWKRSFTKLVLLDNKIWKVFHLYRLSLYKIQFVRYFRVQNTRFDKDSYCHQKLRDFFFWKKNAKISTDLFFWASYVFKTYIRVIPPPLSQSNYQPNSVKTPLKSTKKKTVFFFCCCFKSGNNEKNALLFVVTACFLYFFLFCFQGVVLPKKKN